MEAKEKIEIVKLNDTYAGISCENYIAYALDEFFQYYVPGYRFMPSYKNKSWDGKIHLFNLRTRQIYVGLVEYIKNFAESNDYDIVIDEELQDESSITPKEIADFVHNLDIHSGGNKITPRDYQLYAIFHALKKRRTLLLSPTSSGKSLIIYSITRYLQEHTSGKILILVPTVSLVSQMYGDFADYSTNDSWDVEENCHQIMGGREKHTKKRVIISTWQSLFKMPADYFDDMSINSLLVDESHLATGQSLTKITEKITNCPYKLGFTGTLAESKTHKLVLEGLFGKVKKVISTKELMDKKTVADLTIKAVMLQYSQDECLLMKKAKYQDEVKWLEANERRSKFLANLCLAQKKNTLMLFTRIEHGKRILKEIEKKITDDRKVYFVTGNMKAEVREEIRHRVEEEEDSIILASYGVFSTGTNIKRLHSIIFGSSTKSKIRTLQSLGRGLRVNKEKTKVVLYDVIDNLSHKSHSNYGLKHFKNRADFYNTEKFDWSIENVRI